ncbi:hypothetical protein ACIRTB_19955 [Streptomyces sp. NPDC101158]|uniref:hypothetical protein n=1 Tax=Streptomyces sp. NPDC101158 TaxID=3366117 RepID=UPI0037FA6FC8
MEMSELVRAELGRHDWAALGCGCGDSAEHVPLLFETILTAESVRDMQGYTLQDHVVVETYVHECTPPAVGVILGALAGDVSPPAREELLDALGCIALGASHAPHGLSPEEARIEGACRAAAHEGFWILAHLGLTGNADDAATVADICASLGLGGDKYADYQRLFRGRAAAKTKRGRGRYA